MAKLHIYIHELDLSVQNKAFEQIENERKRLGFNDMEYYINHLKDCIGYKN